MNNSSHNLSSSEKTSSDDDQPQGDGRQFGVVDIVDAFTAMRHEWRGQTRESRELAEQIQATVATLQNLEMKLLDRVAEQDRSATDDSNALAQLVAETDHQFTRAVRAIEQADTHRRLREEEEAQAIERYYSSLSALVRWFARPLFNFLTEQREARGQRSKNPGLEGLHLVLARLRRSMKEIGIERVETEGQTFDGKTMNAIGTMDSAEHPSGHVAEQVSPCYLWQGQVLRFADVRVAN